MGGCRCLFGGAGDADGPHELVDILVPVAIITGVRIVVQDGVAGGEVQRCWIDDVRADVVLSAVGALGPDNDFSLNSAWVGRVGDVGIRGVVPALHILHRFGFVSVGDRLFCGVVLPHGNRGFGARNA